MKRAFNTDGIIVTSIDVVDEQMPQTILVCVALYTHPKDSQMEKNPSLQLYYFFYIKPFNIVTPTM